MPSRLFKFFFTYHPSSAQVARTYADNVNRPLVSLLTALRLAYYAYLLGLAIRMCLNFFFGESYNEHDSMVYLFDCMFRYHMTGLAVAPFGLLALVFDYTIVLRPHQKVAPMLTDLLQSKGLFLPIGRQYSGRSCASVATAASSQSGSFLNFYSSVLLSWIKNWPVLVQRSLSFLPTSVDNSNRHHRHQRTLPPTPPLAYFRSFSLRTRRRLALYDSLIEFFCVLSLPFEAIFVASSVIYFTWRASVQFRGRELRKPIENETGSYPLKTMSPAQNSLFQLQVFSELAVLLLVGQYIYKQVLLFLKTIPLFSLAWYLHAREVLQSAVRQMKTAEYCGKTRLASLSNLYSPTQIQFLKPHTGNTTSLFRGSPAYLSQQRLSASIGSIWVNYYMREHCQLLVNLVHFNRYFASPLIFAFYTPILVGSIYVLCLLYFLPGQLILKGYLLLVLSGLIWTFSLLAIFSVVVQTLYARLADNQLFRAQMFCRGSWDSESGNAFLRIKIKISSYYEVLRTEKKVTFTFGSHAKVDNTWLCEVNESVAKRGFSFIY